MLWETVEKQAMKKIQTLFQGLMHTNCIEFEVNSIFGKSLSSCFKKTMFAKVLYKAAYCFPFEYFDYHRNEL